MRFKSFRLRLTLWYVAFFSLLFVLFSIFLYGVLSRGLERRVDDALVAEVNTAVAMFEDEMAESNGDPVKSAHEVTLDMRLHDSLVAVLSGTQVLASTTPIPPGEVRAIAAGADAAHGPELLVPRPGWGRYGTHTAIHRLKVDRHGYVVVTAQPLDVVATDLRVLREVLFFGMPFLVALAGIGGYLVATRSLAPLGWMAEQSRRITGQNLHTRLEIGNAAEELAVLASSFNELLSRLDQSFESMRRFVADASHELRTPISVIRGEADVALSHDRGTAEYRESLAIILDESRRLSRLVDDLLNLARADAGAVRLQVQEFYFNDLLAECCRSVQALAAARRIRLECRPGEDVPFHGDEELLRRLVLNLLDNAIRYTPVGGQVTASLDASGSELRIRVADTGAGIPPETAEHVFERFYRGDKARSRQEGGFGLGLAIVKWIAESHKGEVALASRPGQGSTFTVKLPR
ncbi:MAG TPA: heavy metal sensor histidine kinase [Candidatus Sulfopaludibacter sp.]|nr:heavy metal sensor histidine kinase [Candidatus Sulfopaludibacter sp.]